MPINLPVTLGELIAIPSQNPMGRLEVGPHFFEHRLTEHLQRWAQQHGIAAQRQNVAPLRDNLVLRIDGEPHADAGGRVLLWDAHQDTVPVEGMTIDPFRAELREGRIYGRGACDIKGGMTAMLAALVRLREEQPRPRPTVILALTVNEEHGFTGAKQLTRLWTPKTESVGCIIPRRPDAAIVAEPTSLDIVVAHKGAVRWKCHTHGRAVHSSQPQGGDNAIYRMARVLATLQAYADDVVPGLADHLRCGHPTLSVGTIHGGLSVNTVPDRCTIEIDRRVVPGESPETAYRHTIQYLAERLDCGFPIEHEPPFLQSPGLPDADNAALAEQLAGVVQQWQPPGAAAERGGIVGVPYGTNAASYAAAGVPAVVFGPGSIEQAHTADEWLPVDELMAASEALYRFAVQF